jgi:hypothetical protein
VAGVALGSSEELEACPGHNPFNISGLSRCPQIEPGSPTSWRDDRLRALRQLGDDRGGAGKQLRRCSTSRLLLEKEVGERLTGGIADDEAGVVQLLPGRDFFSMARSNIWRAYRLLVEAAAP